MIILICKACLSNISIIRRKKFELFKIKHKIENDQSLRKQQNVKTRESQYSVKNPTL